MQLIPVLLLLTVDAMWLAASSSRLISTTNDLWAEQALSPLRPFCLLYHSNRDEIWTRGIVVWRCYVPLTSWVWTLSPQTVGLFGKVVELLGNGALLGKGGHREVGCLCFLTTYALYQITSCHHGLCGGLDEKCPHRYVNTWYPVGGAVQEFVGLGQWG